MLCKKEIENLEFVQGVNFELLASFKYSGTKYFLICDDPCEQTCNSKEFADIDTAGKHRGLSATYIRHNLYHQSKRGRDVELQNTHIVHFKSPHDKMQVSTVISQLVFGSNLIDWYREPASVPYGHLLIDLSQRTDDRLRHCTNNGTIHPKIIVRSAWSIQRLWTINTQILCTLQVFQSFSHKSKSHFLQRCPKEFIRFLFDCIINVLKGNLHSTKRHHMAKFQSEIRLLSLKRTIWKQRRDILE